MSVETRTELVLPDGRAVWGGTMDDMEEALRQLRRDGRPPMKPDATFGAAAELRQFVKRLEALDERKRAIGKDRKAVMAEAKARGYDTRVLRLVLARRRRRADELAEEEAILRTYLAALGEDA